MSTDPQTTDVPGHDDHAIAHGGEPLGPIDLRAWGAAILGVAFGAVTAACFVISTSAA